VVGLQVVIFFGKRHFIGPPQLSLILKPQLLRVNHNFSREKSWSGDEFERGVANFNELPREPEEGLLEVVVRLGGDLEVLEVLLSVERHSCGLDLSILDIHFITTQHDRDVLAYAFKIAMPIWDVFVRDSGSDIEHDDPALALDVVPIAETTEFLLSGSIPDVEADGAIVGGKGEGVDFNTEGSNVFLLEFTGQVTLDESSFASSAISDKNELEGWDLGSRSHLSHDNCSIG